MAAQEQRWAGLDWSDQSHTICVIDDRGIRVSVFTVAQTEDGMAELVRRLRAVDGLAGIALEATRHLVVHTLSSHAFTVYPVNPKMAAAWRKGWSVTGAKSDPGDAEILADGLRHYYERLRPLRPDNPRARELALLCEEKQAFITERTALVNKLQATLKGYFPAALEWFDDWTSPTAWDFVLTFSTPHALAAASSKKLYGFLKTHCLGLKPKWRERVERASKATALAADEATEAAMTLRAGTLAKQLKTLAASLDAYRQRINQLFEESPDAALFRSLPGAGEKLAPRLATIFGEDRERLDSAKAVQQLTGTAPVTYASGKKTVICFRWACSKYWRNTMHLFAWCSIRQCAWARAFYDGCRARGGSNALALRKLSFKGLKIIFTMWQRHETYNESRYIEALKKQGSPLAGAIACNT